MLPPRVLRASRPTLRAPRPATATHTPARAYRPSLRARYPATPQNSNPSPNPGSTPSKPPSAVRAFYSQHTYPVLKAFLGALFTYQLAYYLWLKLEVVEEKHENQKSVSALKDELKREVVESRARKTEEGKGEAGKEKVVKVVAETVEQGKKRWWGW